MVACGMSWSASMVCGVCGVLLGGVKSGAHTRVVVAFDWSVRKPLLVLRSFDEDDTAPPNLGHEHVVARLWSSEL